MSFVSAMNDWLFGRKHKPAIAAAPDQPKPAASDTDIYIHDQDAAIGRAQQHRWLFDEGVVHWNRHRLVEDFKPSFAGVNFVREAAKSRLWGCPADLSGDDRVVLTGVDLKLADLQGTNLVRADLRNAQLQGANLRNANLTSANLAGADLTDCDLRGAILDRGNFSRTRLVSANLSGASLKETNFAWANISHMTVGAKSLREALTVGVTRSEFTMVHP